MCFLTRKDHFYLSYFFQWRKSFMWRWHFKQQCEFVWSVLLVLMRPAVCVFMCVTAVWHCSHRTDQLVSSRLTVRLNFTHGLIITSPLPAAAAGWKAAASAAVTDAPPHPHRHLATDYKWSRQTDPATQKHHQRHPPPIPPLLPPIPSEAHTKTSLSPLSAGGSFAHCVFCFAAEGGVRLI